MKMTNKNTKKTLNRVLIPAVLLVWGFIIFRIGSAYLAGKEDTAEQIDNTETEAVINRQMDNTTAADTVAEGLGRDPFRYSSYSRKTAAMPEQQIIPAPQIRKPEGVKFRIAGTIINATRKVVLLEDLTNDKTLFLRENEKYSTIKIISITNEVVKVENNGEPLSFKLENNWK